jgi:SUMO ligase MMS21 Smc5/6 complex component
MHWFYLDWCRVQRLGHVNIETKFGYIKVEELIPSDPETRISTLQAMHSAALGY